MGVSGARNDDKGDFFNTPNGTGHKVQPQRGLNRIESAWFGCYPFAGRVAAPADIVNMAPPTG